MTQSDDMRHDLDVHGLAVLRSALNEGQLCSLLAVVSPDTAQGSLRHRSGLTYGARGLLASRPQLAVELNAVGLNRFASDALGRPAFPIDAIFFDKHPDANWAVPAHQDVVVPVPQPADASTVRRLRSRNGMTHGEPPESVLDELLAVRVHFDLADENTGPLCVAAGTHRRGRITEFDISTIPLSAYQSCRAGPGDLLFIKPLVVHRSGKSTRNAHRRVLHLVYAPTDGWHAQLLNGAARLGLAAEAGIAPLSPRS